MCHRYRRRSVSAILRVDFEASTWRRRYTDVAYCEEQGNVTSHHVLLHRLLLSERTYLSMRTVLKCQLFLALTQTAFVLGSVYFKYSVNHVDRRDRINPVVFAFVRESIAGSMMGLLAYLSTSSVPRMGDAPKLLFIGLALYFNQLFYIMGVDMSGVVVATCMQPAIPVFTAALALTLGMEQPSLYKTFGILMASAGSICMVYGFPS